MLKLDNISKVYKVGTFGGKELPAVRNVSFDVAPGDVVSLIGESGSGKTTVGKMILRLIDVTHGRIDLDGADIATIKGGHLKAYYGRVQGVFQDPFSSFNPMYKADHVLGMMRDQYFSDVPATEWKAKVETALEAVRLNPGQVLNKYPHQLSGGQLQRMLIARALLLEIEYLVADEIISMLDASTRIDVLNLLGELQTRGLGILFITHDLSLGNYISEKTVILRRGAIVEMGATEHVFGNPRHPYTKTLLSSVPHLHHKWSEVEEKLRMDAVAQEPCPYHSIYPDARASTGGDGQWPALAEVEPGHLVACARLDEAGSC